MIVIYVVLVCMLCVGIQVVDIYVSCVGIPVMFCDTCAVQLYIVCWNTGGGLEYWWLVVIRVIGWYTTGGLVYVCWVGI